MTEPTTDPIDQRIENAKNTLAAGAKFSISPDAAGTGTSINANTYATLAVAEALRDIRDELRVANTFNATRIDMDLDLDDQEFTDIRARLRTYLGLTPANPDDRP